MMCEPSSLFGRILVTLTQPKNVSEMRKYQMTKNLYCKFIILLCSVFLISCTTKNIRQEELIKPHDLLVIPYKAAPINIRTMHFGRVLALALTIQPHLAYDIEKVTTKTDVEKIAEILEKMRGEWNPSTALANECSGVIKNNRKVQINTITITNPRELPGAEDLRLADPNVFSKTYKKDDENIHWARLSGSKWLPNDSPTIPYKQEYPQNTADWALEIFIPIIGFRNESLAILLAIKMFNINTGEKIATAEALGTFDITPIKDESGFKQFEKEFGVAAKQLCGSALNKIGLISRDE